MNHKILCCVVLYVVAVFLPLSCGSGGGGGKDSGAVGEEDGAAIQDGDGGGQGDGDTGNPGDQSTADKTGQISSNHGHIAVLTGAQQDAGAAVQLDIQGTATHTHSLDLTGQQVTSIKDGSKVAKESSVTLGHSHTITFN